MRNDAELPVHLRDQVLVEIPTQDRLAGRVDRGDLLECDALDVAEGQLEVGRGLAGDDVVGVEPVDLGLQPSQPDGS